MAQFRTSADIQNEVLQKAGEPTNGNSPFETIAMTYLNKVHHAVIGGGSIFNVDVDEPWVWARAKHPIVLELQPAFTTGSITATNGSTSITFSSAPTSSLEGWYLQVNGKPTVYRLRQHTASATAAELDSSFVNDSGSYGFRVFKLDYEVSPAYVYVDSYSDRIEFKGTASSTFTASLTHGSYSPASLVAHVTAQMSALSTVSWTGAYDSIASSYALTASVSSVLYGASGATVKRSALPILGFNVIDQTATSFTSTYTPHAVARLIEPMKIFSSEVSTPFIYSTDPIKLQEDYPMATVEERVPERFCRISEDNGGKITVRFSSYPADLTKVVIDWIPMPADLQDNAASVPLLPRGDMDVLIHGAAAFIAFDKEDTKFDLFMKLTDAGLQAMQKKNRALLRRTGEYFGQIIPRSDYTQQNRILRYGYTVSGSVNTTVDSVQTFTNVTMSYTGFQTAATASAVLARNLAADRTLLSLIIKHTESFAGAGISAVIADIGIASDPTKFVNGFDVLQATASSAQDSAIALYYPGAETPINVRITATGANLTALSAGRLVVSFQEAVIP